MKKILALFDKFFSNKGKFEKTDILYRKAFLLNAVLIIMFVTTILLAAMNFHLKSYINMVANVTGFILILFTIFYFYDYPFPSAKEVSRL